MADAVITTDELGQVKYINPVAERLTGWQAAEAKGRPLAEIFPIVDQSTRQPVTNPVDLILQEKSLSELVKDVLLIARDGTEYAIEDSAAPIKNGQGKIIGAVIVFRNVTQSRQIAQKLSWQATHDPLTGLYNRRKFEEKVSAVIKDSQNNKSRHALCYLDLDRFKIVNDTCGHAAGDELLQQVTQLLKKRIRASDVFARLGGDEFGLLLHQCPIEIAPKIADQLRQLIQDFRFTWEDKVFRIGVSIGVVALESTTDNLVDLLSTADAACYAAKEKGRNCVYVYHQQDTVVSQQRGERQWIEKLNRALEENRFCLYAQKIISLEENCDRHHYEILLRLIDESGKLIAPGVFLPAAERYDLMPAIDRWVVTTFLAGYEVYCRSRKEQKLEPPTNLYTINLSGASINNQEFGTFLQEQFERYAIPPETICFEITETVAISNLDNAITLIKQLRELGCSIALDDFGSGMSSFAYLKNLPVDYLKIDGSFIKNIVKDSVDYATVECFNHISQIMNIQTIAEFVEDNAILQSLQQIGVNYAQGYGIERPQPLIFG
ncbi:MAG: EAL domain-containing protein [Xenococcaceae cyanobacterium MO_188.B32]|nr:EAL domain-containing protein [Xenococcaceae cyanobacterium MO_188.B32]